MRKEKKIVFSEEVDSKINGFALALAFIGIGGLLIYDNSYFGNEIVSSIIRWLFIVAGALGLSVEASKIGKGNIKGVDNLLIGIFLLCVWFILYFLLSSWIVNTVAFFFLVFGTYGTFRGLFEIIYSMRQLVKSDKKKKSSAVTDVLLLLTTILGLILVAIQILQQISYPSIA